MMEGERDVKAKSRRPHVLGVARKNFRGRVFASLANVFNERPIILDFL